MARLGRPDQRAHQTARDRATPGPRDRQATWARLVFPDRQARQDQQDRQERDFQARQDQQDQQDRQERDFQARQVRQVRLDRRD